MARSQLILTKFDNIYFYRPFIDFRKGVYSLATLVQDELGLNPFQKNLYLFCNRKSTRIKALLWHGAGFAMVYRLLEKEKYCWPNFLEDNVIYVDMEKFNQFIQGLNPWQAPHKELFYEKV